MSHAKWFSCPAGWLGALLLCAPARAATELARPEGDLSNLLASRGVAASFADPCEEGYPSRWASFDRIEAFNGPDLERFAATFGEALGRYAPDWPRKAGLRRVVFVRNLRVAGTARAAMPDARSGTLYYDISALSGSDPFDEEVIHHELFHLASSALSAGAARAWDAANPPGFRYGSGGARAYEDPAFRNEPFPKPGFVDRYAMTAVEEDRAELFGWLMTPAYARKLMDHALRDPTLRAKLEYTRQWVSLL